MPEVEFPAFELPQPRAVTEALKNVSSQTQALMEEFLQGCPSTDLKALDPLGLLPAYAEFCKQPAGRSAEASRRAIQRLEGVYGGMARERAENDGR